MSSIYRLQAKRYFVDKKKPIENPGMDSRAKKEEGLLSNIIRSDGEYVNYGSNDEWQILTDILGDYVIIINPKGSIIKSNPAVSKKLGYTESELLGKNIFELYPKNKSAEAEEIYSQIIMGEKFFCDIPFLAKDGSNIEVETRITFGKWRGSDIIFSISRDVTAGKAMEYELRLAFEKLKSILNSVSAYIWSGLAESDGSFKYIYQSQGVQYITGRDAGYFRGPEQWIGIIHPDDKDIILKTYQSLAKGRTDTEDMVYRVNRADGSERWVRDMVQSKEIGNRIVRLDGIIYDITERRQAMLDLEESERRIRGIISSMPDMVFAFDQDMRFTFFHTPEMGDIYIEPDKITGEKHSDVMPPHVDALFQDAFKKIQDGSSAEYGYWLVAGSEKKWFATKLSPIISGGIFDGAVAVIRDVTSQKMLEEALRVSEKRYKNIFANIGQAFAMVNMEGRIIEFNDTFRDLIGYEADEISKLTYRDITPDKWHKVEDKILNEQLLKRGYSDTYKKEYRKKDGTIVPIELRTYLVKDIEGNPEYMWAIIHTS
jgi:PAS domain S-box-containing protein